MCRGPIPDYPLNRPTVPEVVALIKQIYATPLGICGCCLHVMTEDNNIDSADWCFMNAQHSLCRTTAQKLMQMTTSQRRRAITTALRKVN